MIRLPNSIQAVLFAFFYCFVQSALTFQTRPVVRAPSSSSSWKVTPYHYYNDDAAASTSKQTFPLFAADDEAASTDIEGFLNERYPAFSTLLKRNEKACKILRENSANSGGFTVFAPNDQAFVQLGEEKCSQLSDPRNAETAEKIGAYHVINEPVSASALFNAGGVITMGGEVPIDRSTSGGFFGFGGKEDGGVTVNGAKVVQSIEVGPGVVHEMDGLISPNLLWRYLDQLRIPGSK